MTQDEKRYNGWTNYETWVTALWLDNEQSTYSYWRDAARECRASAPLTENVKNGYLTIDEATRVTLARRLEDEVSRGSPINEASLYADLLGAAFQEVNWREIADNYLGDD